MAKKRTICAAWGCKNPVSKGRRKYCSAECQTKTARKLTRKWRTKRDHAHQEESANNIPAQIKRYKIKGGGEVYGYLQDDSLISNRNPMGSTYVDQIVRWVDTLWPDETADSRTEPAHRVLIVVSSERASIAHSCLRLFKKLACLDVNTEIMFFENDDDIFSMVQDYRPTILMLYKVKLIKTILSRVKLFSQEGMLVTYVDNEEPNEKIKSHIDGFIQLTKPIKWSIIGNQIRDYLFELWTRTAKERSWLT